MSKVLGDLAIDTNAVIAYRSDDAPAVAWIEACAALLIPVVVVGELEYGALHSARPTENLQRLEELLRLGTVLDITRSTARNYAEIRQALSALGKPIPEADLWIAACCRENNLPLLSVDGHFDVVPGLKRYDWAKPISIE